MTNETPLSDLYRLYVKGKLAKKDLEGKVFQYLLDNHHKYRIFARNSGLWGEYLSWLYPRLVRAIEYYREMGSSFDAYISGVIHNTSKEYRRGEMEHFLTERACWTARTEEMAEYVSETEPDYSPERNDILIPEYLKPRQILLVLLKSYYFVSDEMMTRAAERIGVTTEYLKSLIDEIRKRRSSHDGEILDLRERVHCQFYRCIAYEKRMKAVLPGTDYYEKMKDRSERARKRFRSMKNRLDNMRLGASHKMIAEVTGIPKGTIDSTFFAIKKLMASRPREDAD
jgi:DNA-directed RNA polymerase specialized sigma24 family protein